MRVFVLQQFADDASVGTVECFAVDVPDVDERGLRSGMPQCLCDDGE